jgi:hypothetical protein
MDPVVHHTLRLAVSVLFFFALWHKVDDFQAFKRTLADYRIVATGLVPITAGTVVFLEGVVVLLNQLPAIFALAGVLLVAYAALIAANLLRGVDRIDCGCVGVAGLNGLSWWLVARNLVCAAAAFAVVVPTSGRPMEWMDYFVTAAGTASLVGIYVAADALVANHFAYRRLREAA